MTSVGSQRHRKNKSDVIEWGTYVYPCRLKDNCLYYKSLLSYTAPDTYLLFNDHSSENLYNYWHLITHVCT
jgi:hypothetical protein